MIKTEPKNILLTLKSIRIEGSIIGSLGVYKIQYTLINNNPQAVSVHYTFPSQNGSIPMSFHMQSGNKRIFSEILDLNNAQSLAKKTDLDGLPNDIFVIDDTGSLTLKIGRIESGQILSIEIKYMQIQNVSMGRTIINMPSLIPQTNNSDFELDFHFDYVSYSLIQSIESPTHELKTNIYQNMAHITVEKAILQNNNLIIKILESAEEKPFVFYNKPYCIWSFTPTFKSYQISGKEYIFLIDCSASISFNKFAQIKDALLVCLRGLSEHDKFNIIAYENLIHYFSLTSMPFNQLSLESAERWLEQLKPMGEASLLKGLHHALDGTNTNRVVYLATDGHIKDKNKIINFIKEQAYGKLFILGTDPFSDSAFINEAARSGRGFSKLVNYGERLDYAFVSFFYTMQTSGLYDVKITPNNSVNEFIPKYFESLHDIERVFIAAKTESLPTKMALDGDLDGSEYKQDISFETCITNMNLKPLFSYTRLKALLYQLSTENNTNDKLIKREIFNISQEDNILTPYSVLCMKLQIEKDGVPFEIIIPAKYIKSKEKSERIETNTIKTIKGQNPDGSFGKGGMAETADSLLSIFLGTLPITPFRWQIKKSIEYLFDLIQNGDYDVIPKEVIYTFNLWCNNFSEYDLFTKKIEAIVLMNRDLL